MSNTDRDPDENSDTPRGLYSLPRAFDDIYVRYKLNDGRLVWWPTKVMRITVREDDGEVKADASLLYAAAYNTKECEEAAQFLKGRALFTRDGNTVWRSKMEAADAGEGDSNDEEWIDSARAGRRKRKRQGGGKRRPGKRNKAASTNSSQAPNGSEGHISGACEGEKRTRQTRTQKHTQLPVHWSQPSESPQTEADCTETESPKSTEAQPARVIAHVAKLQNQVNTLEKTVARLQQKIEDDLEEKKDEVVELIVCEKKYMWRTLITDMLDRPLRPSLSSTVTPFNSALQFKLVQAKQQCDYASFQMIVEDILSKYGEEKCNGVLFRPSLNDLRRSPNHISTGHIIFNRGTIMLKWLGIQNEDALRKLIYREQNLKGKSSIRVLGGARWNKEDDTVPLTVLLGASSSDNVSENPCVENELYRAVQFKTPAWDTSNQTFVHPASLVKTDNGELCFFNPETCKGLFKISWKYLDKQSARTYSRRGIQSDGLRMGEVTLAVPCAAFYCEVLCAQLKELVSNRVLDLCL